MMSNQREKWETTRLICTNFMVKMSKNSFLPLGLAQIEVSMASSLPLLAKMWMSCKPHFLHENVCDCVGVYTSACPCLSNLKGFDLVLQIPQCFSDSTENFSSAAAFLSVSTAEDWPRWHHVCCHWLSVALELQLFVFIITLSLFLLLVFVQFKVLSNRNTDTGWAKRVNYMHLNENSGQWTGLSERRSCWKSLARTQHTCTTWLISNWAGKLCNVGPNETTRDRCEDQVSGNKRVIAGIWWTGE